MPYLLATATAIAAAGAIPLFRHHHRRTRLYRELARQRASTVVAYPSEIAAATGPVLFHKEFARERIVRVEGFLDDRSLQSLQGECVAGSQQAERSHIPGHKKGGTLSYEGIHHHAPACLALYHSQSLQRWLSDLVGVPLQPTADHDQSACSLLYYDQAGDHIGWHFDHNFYRGRHFTVLLSLLNRSADGGLSAGRLQRRSRGEVGEVDTRENTLVIFEGAKVFHRATKVREGDTRVMLSMTFCTDRRIGFFRELVRRIKDTAYYGPRILFD